MKRSFTILTAAFALLAILAIPMGMMGQTTTLVSGLGTSGYSIPDGWTSSGTVEGGSYLKFDDGTITSPEFAPHNGLSFTYSVATFGSGTNHPLTIRILNASTDEVIVETTTATPTSSSYISTGSPLSLGDVTVAFKIEMYGPTGKGVRLRNYSITGTPAGGQQLTTSDLALVNAPVELEFDLYDNANAQTISYTTSSTGVVTVSQSNYITATVNANNTITVTPVAVTNGPQTITVNQAADNTYDAGSVTFTVDIEDSTPTTGTDVTFDATTDQGDGSIIKDGITFACDNGVLNNGTEYRLYKNSTTTFSVESGTITQIVFNCTSGNPASGFGTQTGWTTNGNNGTWTGNATSVSFVASSKQVRATTIVVTVETSGTPDPTISADDVDIAYSATSGSITYTINNEPSPAGTLTAAVTEGNWLTLGQGTTSPIAFTCSANENTTARTATVTLTYTYDTDQTVTANVTVTQAAVPVSYTTIPALFAAATSTETPVYVTFNNWVVSGISTNGKNVFVTDNNGNGFVIYDNNGGLENTYTVGHILAGTAVSCTLKKYNGFAELLNVTATDLTITSGGTVAVADVAMADLAGVNTGALLHYDNLTCVLTTNNAGTTTFYNLTDGTTTIQVYNAIYAFGTLVEGKTYNITGIYQQYNNTKEILPRNAADIEEVTYTLNITGYGNSDGGYYLIASPVTMNPSTNGMTTGDYDLYTFNQAEEDEWRNYKAGAFTNLEPGKGYLYAHKTGGEFTLSGEAYTGDGAITLFKTEGGDFPGWNLVGNPFNTSAQINRDFYILNSTGDELIQSNGLIAPMQGIFVIATTNGETLTFEPVGGEPADPMPEDKKVVLNINSNTSTGSMTIDRAVVRFGEGRTLPKFQLNPDNTKVYFTEGNENFAVVRSANEGEMPVSFKASENGRYTISVNAENIEMEYLHLIDNMTGANVDLLATPSYSFEANTTDYTSRFRLVFSANNGISEQSNETFAFFNGSNWVVNNNGEATLQVIDMTGRVLSSEQINGSYNKSLNLSAGVYVLRLSNGNAVKTQKVVID